MFFLHILLFVFCIYAGVVEDFCCPHAGVLLPFLAVASCAFPCLGILVLITCPVCPPSTLPTIPVPHILTYLSNIFLRLCCVVGDRNDHKSSCLLPFRAPTLNWVPHHPSAPINIHHDHPQPSVPPMSMYVMFMYFALCVIGGQIVLARSFSAFACLFWDFS